MRKTNKTKLVAVAMATIKGGEKFIISQYIAITSASADLSRSDNTLPCYG